jgi:hypothetical protein
VSLRRFYEDIGPYLLGTQGHAETVERLYGAEATSSHRNDAERLSIYGRFCRLQRHEAVDFLFAHCRATVVERQGEESWAELVHRYFLAHPMHHFEINRNGEYLPGFLAGLAATGEVAPFLGELADLEWWEWLVETAPDPSLPPPAHTRQLHPLVELRSYHYDLVGWLDDDERRSAAPRTEDHFVLFWRDKKLRGRREPASHRELMVIKAVVEKIPLDAALANLIGLRPEDLTATVDDLLGAGILT